MDNALKNQRQVRLRQRLAGGLALGSLMASAALIALTTHSMVATPVVLLLLLAAGASWLLYIDWRKEARDARSLLAQGLSYRTLLRTASDGIHVLDREGRITELSDSFAAMLGRSRESLIGESVTSWDCKYSAEEVKTWFASFEPGMTRTFCTVHRRADGTQFDVEITSSGVRIDGRDFIYCSARDISELLLARRHLQAALHEQQLMLDNDLIGIVKTRKLSTIWSNPAMSRIFGYAPEALLNHPLRMLYPDEAAYREFVEEAVPVLRAGGRYRRQMLTLRKNGEQVWIDVNGVLLSQESQEALWLLADITPIRETLQRAEHIALHDVLTGLPNRLLMADRLRHGLAQAEREHRMLALCYLDLDGFKHVNDELGHAAGDELLRETARRLEQCVRANDTVCRIGGDEFVLLLSLQDDMAEALLVLERVRLSLARPHLLEGRHTAEVTVSIGVAAYPRDGLTPAILMENADRAMYRAKRAGRNRICVYEALLDVS